MFRNDLATRSVKVLEQGLYLVGTVLLARHALRARPLWSRLLAGSLAGGLLYGALRRSGLRWRALERRSPSAPSPLRVAHRVPIRQPPEVLYAFWRNFENLPSFMRNLESVTVQDELRSRWCARAPLGRTVEWDSEVTHVIPNAEIGWRSLPGSELDTVGVVRFLPMLDGGTEVEVEMLYEPPGGRLGAVAARFFGEDPRAQMEEDLERLRSLLESGEVLTASGAGTGEAGPRPGLH